MYAIRSYYAIYAAESGALPSGEDMVAMVNDYVRDEVLAREARRLKLRITSYNVCYTKLLRVFYQQQLHDRQV